MGRLLYFLEERVPEDLRALVRNYISLEGHDFQTCFYSEPEHVILSKLNWAEVVLFAPGRYLPGHIFQSCQHIKLMQLWSSGYDKFNLKDAKKHSINVANNGGANAISVAEHTIMLILAAARRLPECHTRVTNGMWAGNSHGMDMVMLYGKTLSIIGMGNIGRQVAKRAASFGMKIIYYDPIRLDTHLEDELNAELVDLKEVLSRADFLSLHIHLNESTRGILGKSELSLLKEGCVLVNVSRSQLIDLQALEPLLVSKQVRAAGFDVFDNEPTTGYEPCLSLPNVVTSPHTAGSTIDTYHMALRNCMENISLALSGNSPLWLLN